jgi:hypothetical protein
MLKRSMRTLELESFFCVGRVAQFRVKCGGSCQAGCRRKVRELPVGMERRWFELAWLEDVDALRGQAVQTAIG